MFRTSGHLKWQSYLINAYRFKLCSYLNQTLVVQSKGLPFITTKRLNAKVLRQADR
jgi:hypothetical protein